VYAEKVHERVSQMDVAVDFIPDEAFLKAKDPRAARNAQKRIRKTHDILKQLIKCK
jgi:hypothetical protein